MGEVVTEDNCFIGAIVTILPGVTLARGTVVGAGSVVTKSIKEENQVVVGNPARVITETYILRKKYMNNCFDLRGINKRERKFQIISNMENMSEDNKYWVLFIFVITGTIYETPR